MTPKDRSEGGAGSQQTGQRTREQGDQNGNQSKKPKTAAGPGILMKEANSLNMAYHKSMGQVISMVRNIKNNNVRWACANNSQNLGLLQQTSSRC